MISADCGETGVGARKWGARGWYTNLIGAKSISIYCRGIVCLLERKGGEETKKEWRGRRKGGKEKGEGKGGGRITDDARVA